MKRIMEEDEVRHVEAVDIWRDFSGISVGKGARPQEEKEVDFWSFILGILSKGKLRYSDDTRVPTKSKQVRRGLESERMG